MDTKVTGEEIGIFQETKPYSKYFDGVLKELIQNKEIEGILKAKSLINP